MKHLALTPASLLTLTEIPDQPSTSPRIMSFSGPIFCCANAALINISKTKLHNDPNRDIHDAILNSFMNFAYRRQTAAKLMALIRGLDSGPSTPSSSSSMTSPPQEIPVPILTPEVLRNNPITQNTPYVIHLTSRHDFGLVFSHRYFVCPSNLRHDWIEVSLEQWFAAGAQFNLKAEKWDVKCTGDCKFYRLTVRPNLAMRFPLAEQQFGEAHGY